MLGTWIGKLKGKDREETKENYIILSLFVGALVLSFGIGMSVLSPHLSAIFSMTGAWIAFLSTAALIVLWAIKEFRSG